MRDPRFEPARLQLTETCTAGLPSTLRARLLSIDPRAGGVVTIDVNRIDKAGGAIHLQRVRPPSADTLDVALPALAAGGYTARLRTDEGATTRYDFACEAGGDEWADTRPDPDRLRALARATGGAFVFGGDAGSLPLPAPTRVSAERHVTPLAPPWAWTVAATVLLGAHWIARRRGGLS
jgi:hypothetical protein